MSCLWTLIPNNLLGLFHIYLLPPLNNVWPHSFDTFSHDLKFILRAKCKKWQHTFIYMFIITSYFYFHSTIKLLAPSNRDYDSFMSYSSDNMVWVWFWVFVSWDYMVVYIYSDLNFIVFRQFFASTVSHRRLASLVGLLTNCQPLGYIMIEWLAPIADCVLHHWFKLKSIWSLGCEFERYMYVARGYFLDTHEPEYVEKSMQV